MIRKGIVLLALLIGSGIGLTQLRAQSADLWNVIYFSEWQQQGDTVQQEINGQNLSLYWGEASPAEGIPADFFSALFTRGLDVDEPTRYEFVTSGDDGYRVLINDEVFIDQSAGVPLEQVTATIDLAPGRHIINVDYYDAIGNASLDVRFYPLGVEPTDPVDPYLTPLTLFKDEMVRTIFAGEFGVLTEIVDDGFASGVMGSEFSPESAYEAVARLESQFAGVAGLYFDESADLARLLQRSDPVGIFGPNASDILFLRSDGDVEAMLGIGENESGELAWLGAIYAPLGFEIFVPPPLTLVEAIQFIEESAINGLPSHTVSDRLYAENLLLSGDFLNIDIEGDDAVEWAITLSEPTDRNVFGRSGIFMIVNQDGIQYRYRDVDNSFDSEFQSPPSVITVQDMSGDGNPDLVISTTNCGANTCFDSYDVIGVREGDIQSLIFDVENGVVTTSAGEFRPNQSYSEWVIEDATVDVLPDLVIHGGGVGSVGAGPAQRLSTQVWAWSDSDQRMVLDRIDLDPTNLRYHVLMEANDLYDIGHLDAANSLYQRVVLDKSLEDIDGFLDSEATTYDDSRQFAAFRMMLIDALQRDVDSDPPNPARKDWLVLNYPDDPMTEGAVQFFTSYFISNDVSDACIAATDNFTAVENPAGVIEDMGYVWPLLDAEAICVLPG